MNREEAIRRIRAWNLDPDDIEVLSVLIPELKESEDERIRKELIRAFKSLNTIKVWNGIERTDILTWLEKQSNWKPSKDEMDALYGLAYITNKMDDKKDKAITKLYQDLKMEFFNNASYENMFPSSPVDSGINVEKQCEQKPQGKSVLEAAKEEKVDNQNCVKPADKVEPKFKVGDFIVNDYCMGRIVEITNDAYLLDTEQGIPFSGHSTRLWDITKDAKDGDVLSWDDSKCIAIFKNIYDEDSFNSYGFVGGCTGTFESRQSYHDIEGAHPASKEQYVLLFQKMKEAGYEWDAEKKELKKVDQKPAEYGEEGRLKSSEDSCKKSDDISTVEKDMTEYKKGFECGKQRVLKYPEDFNLCKKTLTTWSEEDEAKLKSILFHIEDVENKDVIDWLKSLKDRVQLQNKWKESLVTADLENSLCDIQDAFSDTSYEYRILGEAIEFIRCTESKPQWKPSDEQMDGLLWYLNNADKNSISYDDIESIYNDLKKLKG